MGIFNLSANTKSMIRCGSHSMENAGRSVEHRRAIARRHIEAGKIQQDLAYWDGQSQQADMLRPDWIAILDKTMKSSFQAFRPVK
jgi:hypothetical protein